MDFEKEINTLIEKSIKNNHFGLFCFDDSVKTVQFVSNSFNEENLADQIIFSLKRVQFKNYFFIKKTNKFIYVQIENKLFSLCKEIHKNKENIIFFHKKQQTIVNTKNFKKDLENTLKKIS